MVVLHPQSDHKFTLIWLHGIGDTGSGCKSIFINEELCDLPDGCKVILPTAPNRRVEVNDNEITTSWYNIKGFDLPPDGRISNQFV